MRVASGPDNGETCRNCQTVRACLARSEGVTKVNWWLKPCNREAALKSGGYGPVCSAPNTALGAVFGLWRPSSSVGPEAMVKDYGVAVAMLPG